MSNKCSDMILESLEDKWSDIEYGSMKRPVTWTNDSTRLNAANLNSLSDSIRELQYIADKNETATKEAIEELCDNMIGWSFGVGKGEVFNDYENNTADGQYTHAEGHKNSATGDYSHVEGIENEAKQKAQHVQGKYSVPDNIVRPQGDAHEGYGKYAHIVGNGTETGSSNAHTIDWEGNAWFSGNLKIGGTDYDDTDAKTLATTEYVDTTVEPLQNTLDDIGDSIDIIVENKEAIQNLSSLMDNIDSLTERVTELETIIRTLVSAGTEDPNVTDPGTTYYIRYEE